MSDQSYKWLHILSPAVVTGGCSAKAYKNRACRKRFFFLPSVFSQCLEMNDAGTSWNRYHSGLLCSIAISCHFMTDKQGSDCCLLDVPCGLFGPALLTTSLACFLNHVLVSDAIKQHTSEISIFDEQINSSIVKKLFAETHYKWFIRL